MSEQPSTLSPETLAYNHKAALQSRRYLLLTLIAAAFAVAWLVTKVPVWQERREREAGRQSLNELLGAAVDWGEDNPLGMLLDHYAPSYAHLLVDGLETSTDINPYTGHPRKHVEIMAPTPGDFTYLPLRGRVTRQDGRSFEAALGFVIILWAKRELPGDLVIGNKDWGAAAAATLEGGQSKWAPTSPEHYPRDVKYQSFDEALAEYGLKRLSASP